MNARRRISLPLVLVAGGLGLMLVVQIASATHPRPKSATPVRVSLVPAYEQCTAPNRTHGPPLAFPSCSPPVQTSDYLTVGTPDANGAAANSEGTVKVFVQAGTPGTPDDSMVRISGSITDVRCKAGVSTCGNANTAGGPDYTGQLQGNATVRLTDHFNAATAGGGTDPATMIDRPMPFQLTCASTADPSIGATCVFPTNATECLGCFRPEDGRRTLLELTQLLVRDGGADGQAFSQDNTLFMVQGVFVP
jgi:hypothetical protein